MQEAITAHQDAAAIFEETGDRHRREGVALNHLGLALPRKARGRVQEAITAHQDAAAIFEETGDRHREGIALRATLTWNRPRSLPPKAFCGTPS